MKSPSTRNNIFSVAATEEKKNEHSKLVCKNDFHQNSQQQPYCLLHMTSHF